MSHRETYKPSDHVPRLWTWDEFFNEKLRDPHTYHIYLLGFEEGWADDEEQLPIPVRMR